MKYSFIIFFSFLMFSCNKYLDKPGDPTKRIPSTLDDVRLLMDQPLTIGGTNVTSDDFFAREGVIQSMQPLIRQFYLQWKPNLNGAYLHNGLWSIPYTGVFNANLCLEILNKIPVTGSNKESHDELKGAAFFLRAYSLLSVAWQFAKAYNETTAKNEPGAVLDLNADAFESLQRSSIEETYGQIIKDAEEAVKYLPMYAGHPMRASKLAAYGLLARTYLSMRKYDLALQQCNLFLTTQKALFDFNDPTVVKLSEFYPMETQRFGKEVIYFKTSQYLSIPGGFTNYSVDTNLLASYDVNDVRKTAWFRPASGFHSFRGGVAASNPMNGITTGEMFLMRAECWARTNEVQKSMDDLNELLITRWKTNTYVPYTASNKEEALEIILRERRKELIGRGLRWMDVKRLNEEGRNISIVHKFGSQLYTLPPKDPRFATQIPYSLEVGFGYKQNPTE